MLMAALRLPQHQEAASQLLSLISSLAPKADLDEERVRALIADYSLEMIEPLIGRLRDDIEALRAINKQHAQQLRALADSMDANGDEAA